MPHMRSSPVPVPHREELPSDGDTNLQQLTLLMREQLDAYQRMVQKQLAEQHDQICLQLELQKQHMEKEIACFEAHFGKARVSQTSAGSGGNGLVVGPSQKVIDAAPANAERYSSTVPKSVPLKPEGSADRSKKQLDSWVRCNGLHTVDKWVQDYRNHPAGWAALLTIHGVPEVTNRLRLKVQNYAVFSALFVAGSIKAVSGKTPICNPDPMTWECAIKRRVFTYFFFLTIASHILCIFLAMSFHNALNEAARDSDVFRMFARGKGFRATVTCQRSFRAGALSCCIALVAVAQDNVGWDVVGVAALLFIIAFVMYTRTATPLFRTASIVDYWREELGGNPDAEDPYDLSIPMDHFSLQVARGKAGFECEFSDPCREVSTPSMKKHGPLPKIRSVMSWANHGLHGI